MEQPGIPIKKFLPGIAWFFIVGALTLMPGKDLPKTGWFSKIAHFDKLVHAGLFGGMVLLFCLPYIKSGLPHKEKIQYLLRICLAVIVWGITVEFIQRFYIPGRDFDLFDWAADSVGALMAFWICMRILRHEKKQLPLL